MNECTASVTVKATAQLRASQIDFETGLRPRLLFRDKLGRFCWQPDQMGNAIKGGNYKHEAARLVKGKRLLIDSSNIIERSILSKRLFLTIFIPIVVLVSPGDTS